MSGHQEMSSRLAAAISELRERAKRAVLNEANRIMDASHLVVPKDKGTLGADSGVEMNGSNNEISATLWYGRGAASAYAIPVHENPSSHDPPSWKDGVHFKQGQPKYLERPLRDAIQGMAERLANDIRKV